MLFNSKKTVTPALLDATVSTCMCNIAPSVLWQHGCQHNAKIASASCDIVIKQKFEGHCVNTKATTDKPKKIRKRYKLVPTPHA